MKTTFYLVLLIGALSFVTSCSSSRALSKGDSTVMKPEKNEEGEWELIVMDTQFDYFLSAIAKPQSMYSESSLKVRNASLVSEWNSYYYSGRYRNVIESGIDYDPNENYGMAFEYKLYQVFAYVQWKYGLRLRGLGGAEVR
ncbi:DUF6146 family protein [Chryseobacterium sp. A301]